MKIYQPNRKGEKSRFYYYDFILDGHRYQGSTKLADRRKAERYAEGLRGKIRCGEVDEKGRPFQEIEVPTLKQFAPRFREYIETRCAERPRTVTFYAEKLKRLLEYEPLANASLASIEEALIERYIQHRRKKVAPGTVNRQLATLRRLLRLAKRWKVISDVPEIKLLPGERGREFVLSHAQEQQYLKAAPQPLPDLALFDVDTGLRPSEMLRLKWHDVRLEAVGSAKFGYVHVSTAGKTGQRNVPITERVRTMLQLRSAGSDSPYVFPSAAGKPYVVTSVDHLHSKVRESLKWPKDFVVHSFRHTFGTRLGEAGAEAFAIMKLMGHSSVTTSQKYVHPTPESAERAIERMQNLNAEARLLLPSEQREPLKNVPVISTVSEIDALVSHLGP